VGVFLLIGLWMVNLPMAMVLFLRRAHQILKNGVGVAQPICFGEGRDAFFNQASVWWYHHQPHQPNPLTGPPCSDLAFVIDPTRLLLKTLANACPIGLPMGFCPLATVALKGQSNSLIKGRTPRDGRSAPSFKRPSLGSLCGATGLHCLGLALLSALRANVEKGVI
jgi:hypothetical protein